MVHKTGKLHRALGFTLIELAAVMGVMILLISIVLPMMGKIGLGSQVSATAHGLETFFGTASHMARSTGKLYCMDFDLAVTDDAALGIVDDHFDRAIRENNITRYVVKTARLYYVGWQSDGGPNPDDGATVYRYAGEGMDFPSPVTVSLNDQVMVGDDNSNGNNTQRTDNIYFLPDGGIQAFSGKSEGVNILIMAKDNDKIRYKLEIDEYSGNFVLKDYRQDDLATDLDFS